MIIEISTQLKEPIGSRRHYRISEEGELPVEGEVLGVLFFGFCGLVVLAVPFLDWGRLSRKVLVYLAGLAVVFFIVMTAWGWFPHSLPLATILGTSLFLGMLVMLIPFFDRGGLASRILYTLLGAGALLLLAAIAWGILR